MTQQTCPGCDQHISVDTDGTTECGGIGEGTCAAFNAAADCLDWRTGDGEQRNPAETVWGNVT